MEPVGPAVGQSDHQNSSCTDLCTLYMEFVDLALQHYYDQESSPGVGGLLTHGEAVFSRVLESVLWGRSVKLHQQQQQA